MTYVHMIILRYPPCLYQYANFQAAPAMQFTVLCVSLEAGSHFFPACCLPSVCNNALLTIDESNVSTIESHQVVSSSLQKHASLYGMFVFTFGLVRSRSEL